MSEIEVFVKATVTAYDIVEAFDWRHSEVMDFMLSMDEEVGDLQFTIELRDKLTKAIEEELASGSE